MALRINVTSVMVDDQRRALVEDGIPFTSFAVDDVQTEYERLRAAGRASRRRRRTWAP
jgi:hypothetical protein